MRILIYTHEFPPYAGGAGTYVHDLAWGLRELSQDACVLAPQYGEQDREVDRNVPFDVVRLPFPSGCDGGNASALGAFLRRNDFDCVLVAEAAAQRSAAHLNWSALPSCCITVHGSELMRHFGPHKGRRNQADMRGFFAGARRIIAVSASTERLVRRCLPEAGARVALVHHGVNPDLFPQLPPDQVERQRRRLGGGRVLLCAARVAPGKGHDVLLGALPTINDALGNVSLVVAGGGESLQELRNLASGLGIQRRVVFVGDVPRSDLHRWMGACDLFVMVSRRGDSESFGLVYLEANCCGKPVLAGRSGGVSEAVADGVSGVLVNPTDVNAVAAAAIDLLRDPERLRALGAAGRQRVLRRFTHRHMAENTLEVLQDAF